MRTPLLAAGTAVAVLSTLVACRDLTPPEAAPPKVSADFSGARLSADSVGICLPASTPGGSYTFSWTIQNGQAGDIHDVTSPTTVTFDRQSTDTIMGFCILPWRRTTPLPAGVFVDVIVTETAAPAGVGLDSVEVQDRFGDHVYQSATDTASVDTLSGGTLTYYQQEIGSLVRAPVGVRLLPLPSANPSAASGRVQVRLGVLYPPRPCGPVAARSGGSGVTLCGVIHNPGGETFTEGVLLASGMSVPFGAAALPPNPCVQYVVQGTVRVPAGLVTQLAGDPSGLALRFDSKEHPDGAIGGSPAGGSVTDAAAGGGAGADAQAHDSGACLVRF